MRCPTCRLIVFEADMAEHMERWHGWQSEQGQIIAEMERQAIRNALAYRQETARAVAVHRVSPERVARSVPRGNPLVGVDTGQGLSK